MEDENVETSDLGMSDEDFLNMEAPSYETPDEEDKDEVDDSTEDQDEEEQSNDDTNSEDDTEEGHEDDLSSEDDTDDVEDSDEEVEDTTEDEDTSNTDSDEVDYEALHKQLLQPFKANGVEMSVNNVDEAVKLMQMGANYSKKMTALKPNLKLMKMLENNELLNEASLNLMIDVAKGNPEAISQLVRDNKIDPLNLSTEEENKYTPKNHTVGDSEVELDEVVSRIQDSESFSDTMDIVTTKWDESSKRDIANQPNILEVINEHVSNGTYAKVIAEVERIKTFGGLQGLSTFDAYKQVGDQLYTAGKLDMGQQPSEKVVVKTAPKAKPSDKPRKDKRRAASPSKSTATPKKKEEFNPLSLSDEDFENLKFN